MVELVIDRLEFFVIFSAENYVVLAKNLTLKTHASPKHSHLSRLTPH